ncbi:hypothetical protein Ahu01nite_060600 [Winogradskya humida]|uniref:Uncharacterized protein n=1 Tax=Winogradskya humida TaxID=113566 RepID=A0ABQ3ZX00_9ACTN|nr:hypothetical protein Ahu01nite_060600 [Actinoplanes humidus]
MFLCHDLTLFRPGPLTQRLWSPPSRVLRVLHTEGSSCLHVTSAAIAAPGWDAGLIMAARDGRAPAGPSG